jgi:hypothetical protein
METVVKPEGMGGWDLMQGPFLEVMTEMDETAEWEPVGSLNGSLAVALVLNFHWKQSDQVTVRRIAVRRTRGHRLVQYV